MSASDLQPVDEALLAFLDSDGYWTDFRVEELVHNLATRERPEQAAVINAAGRFPHHGWVTGSLRRLRAAGHVRYYKRYQEFDGRRWEGDSGWHWRSAYWERTP